MSAGRRGGPLRRSVVTLAVAGVVVGLDQWASTWAVHRLARGPVHVIGPLNLELGINTGASFSLAQGWAPLLGALAVVAVVAMVLASRRAASTRMSAALGLVVGGAVGNLIDRIARPYNGGVVDFIHLPHWPTFNVADACITVGVILVAVFLWWGPSGTGRHPDRPDTPGGDAVGDGDGPGATGGPGDGDGRPVVGAGGSGTP